MINIFMYHWVAYLLGFILCPKLTFMIWLSLYFPHLLPLPLFIIGWILAFCPTSVVNTKKWKVKL